MFKVEKKQIVAAAKLRFSHYGYSKTTMAEIAADCQMSVGNLYRFYKNKEDIALEGARSCLANKAEVAEQAAATAELAVDALSLYFMKRLQHLHAFVSETSHMHELVQLISSKHHDLLQHFEDRSKEAISLIVQSGIDSGEFSDCDAKVIAADLYHATNKYNMPLCMGVDLDLLEHELESLLRLINQGMKS